MNWEQVKSDYLYGNYQIVSDFLRANSLDVKTSRKFTKGWRDEKTKSLGFSQKAKRTLEFARQLQGDRKKQESIAKSGGVLTSFGDESIRVDNISLETYTEMLDDPGVLMPLNVVQLPILQMEWTIDSESDEVKEYVEENLHSYWESYLRNILTFLPYGFAGFEKRLDTENDWEPKEPVLLPQPTTIIKIDKETGEFGGLYQDIQGGRTPLIEAENSQIYTYDKRSGNLYGRSILKSAYKAWYIDKFLYEWQLKGYERRLLGGLKAFAPKGSTQIGTDGNGDPVEVDNLVMMQEVAESFRSNAVMTIPWTEEKQFDIEDFSLSFEGLEHLEVAHRALDNSKAKAIFVPDRLAGTDEGGSFNLAETQAELLYLSIMGVVRQIKITLQTQHIDPMVSHKFGNNAPKAKWRPIPFGHKTKKFIESIFVEVLKNKNVDLSDILDVRKIAETSGVPVLSEEEEEKNKVERKQPEETVEDDESEMEDNNSNSSIHFEDRKELTTRDFFPIEKGVKVNDNDGDFENSEKEFLEESAAILSEQKDAYVEDLRKAFNAGTVNTLNAVSIRKQQKYIKFMRDFYRKYFRIGADEVAGELKLEKIKAIPSDTRAWLNGMATLSAQGQMDKLEERTWRAVLNVIGKKEGFDQAAFDVKEIFRRYQRDELPTISAGVGVTPINFGRNFFIQKQNKTKNIKLESIEFQGEDKRVVAAVWNSVRDMTTCEFCFSMHGLVTDINSPTYNQFQFPVHPHCQCEWQPLTDEYISPKGETAEGLINQDEEIWDNLNELAVDKNGRSLVDKHAPNAGGNYENVRVNPPKIWKESLTDKQFEILKSNRRMGQSYESTLVRLIRRKKIGKGAAAPLKDTVYENLLDPKVLDRKELNLFLKKADLRPKL